MESSDHFFADEEHRRTISVGLRTVKALESSGDFEAERNKHIVLILNSMSKTPGNWSANCSINISWVGGDLMSTLSSLKEPSKAHLDDLYALCFRFLLEFYLSIKNDLTMEFEWARKFASQHIEEFDEAARRQIRWALMDMPIAIMKELLNSEGIVEIRKLNESAENVAKLHSQWAKELEEKTTQVNILKNNLDTYKVAFNFVGLYEGFKGLASDKTKEKNTLRSFLILFGVLVLVPISIELTVIAYNYDKAELLKRVFLLSIIPVLSLTGLLVYYFRILLFNFKSVKSQLLQIELRKALCRFIQNYVDYSVVIKQKDSGSLQKFENVIFAPIVPDDSKLPGTFDGLEQLANLIKAVKPS